ncbi:MAG: TadE/TadG family type IV pilus assembly protein [Nitrospirales bacterium]
MKCFSFIHQNANHYSKSERGSTLIESAALMLPFLLLFLGIVEFGWYFLHQHTLQFSTREGMRMALVGSTLLDQNGDALSREESIKKTIENQARWAMNIEPEKIWIYQVGDNYSDPDDWKTSAANAGNPADYMRVRVQYDHEFFTPLISGFFSSDQKVTMAAEGTYRNELF